MKSFKYRKSYLLRKKTAKGFGVHSPFVFSFLTNIASCKHSFYDFYWLDKIWKQTIEQDKGSKVYALKYYHFLYKVANAYRFSTIFKFGFSSNVSLCYLMTPNSKANAYSFSNLLSLKKPSITSLLNNELNFEIFQFDLFKKTIFLEIDKADKIDLLIVSDSFLLDSDIWDIYISCLKKMHSKSLMIVEDISTSKTMDLFWKKVCLSTNISSAIDFLSFGVCFYGSISHRRVYKSIL